MVELFVPTTPDTISNFRVVRLTFDWTAAKIRIEVRDEDGRVTPFVYSGATATTLMNQLNTVDLSTQSLHRRIINRLVADGFLPAGSITGSPD